MHAPVQLHEQLHEVTFGVEEHACTGEKHKNEQWIP